MAEDHPPTPFIVVEGRKPQDRFDCPGLYTKRNALAAWYRVDKAKLLSKSPLTVRPISKVRHYFNAAKRVIKGWFVKTPPIPAEIASRRSHTFSSARDGHLRTIYPPKADSKLNPV